MSCLSSIFPTPPPHQKVSYMGGVYVLLTAAFSDLRKVLSER